MKKILSTILCMTLGASNAFATSVDVNYYWSNPRCVTCNKMENYTLNAVKKMNDKEVQFYMVDASKNKADVKEYGLYTKSVVLTKNVNGKKEWKNLDKIWQHVRNEKAYENYIISEVKKFKGE